MFRIHTHGRLQEWVAEQSGYFRAEGLDDYVLEQIDGAMFDGASAPVGAYQSYEQGRDASVSCACHWTVNMAASNKHGRLWNDAYSLTPAGIFVSAASSIKKIEDLGGVDIAVGYQSGSHYATIQALETSLALDSIKLQFGGRPYERLAKLLAGAVEAATLFGAPLYVAEQLGFRKLADVSFMIIGMVPENIPIEQVARYYSALRRAQHDIDLNHQRFSDLWLKELPAQYHSMVDVRGFGPGERLIFERYSQAMYDQTHKWVEDRDIFSADKIGRASYAEATLIA